MLERQFVFFLQYLSLLNLRLLLRLLNNAEKSGRHPGDGAARISDQHKPPDRFAVIAPAATSKTCHASVPIAFGGSGQMAKRAFQPIVGLLVHVIRNRRSDSLTHA